MALKNYRLAEPSRVILADDRDPHVSWRNHLKRAGAGRGGVDIVAAPGTPVYARTPGVMRRIPNNGSAGNSCRFEHDENPGWADVFSHLTGYVGVDGQHFEVGQVVAYTGTTGGVAPHLHWHLLDPKGNRQNPWDHFTPLAAPRPSSTTTTTPEEDDVSFAEQIDWRGGKVTAAALIVATAINAELAVAKVDALAAKLDAADYTRHNGVDAPNDVVDADTLKVVQQTEEKVNHLVQLLADTNVPSAAK